MNTWLPDKEWENLCSHKHPPKAQEGDKRPLSVFIGGMAIYLFFTQQMTVPLFFCCDSVISKTKEAQTTSIIYSSWVSFLFLSQSSSVEAEQAQATSSSSVFCHGKKLKLRNRKIWYYCDLKQNLHSLNLINIFLFVNPFTEEGQL